MEGLVMTAQQYNMFTGELEAPPTDEDTEPYDIAWATEFALLDAVPTVYPRDGGDYVTLNHHRAAMRTRDDRIAELERQLEEFDQVAYAYWQRANANWQLAMRWRRGCYALLFAVLVLIVLGGVA
jgi:hypothetical protein